MAEGYVLKEAKLVNRGRVVDADVRVRNGRIEQIDPSLSPKGNEIEIACGERYLIPGVIDDQVHFREPGLTHKATIGSESRAAVAGGTTSFMEMPNTVPNTLTRELLEDKYAIAARTSLANYSFFMGASNTNLEEILKVDYRDVCGIKAFLGSSTGNMLLDDEAAIEALFANAPALVAIHAEDEATVRANEAVWASVAEEDLPFDIHARIRPEEACFRSSAAAVARAHRLGTRLHVLHITTEIECSLFEAGDFRDQPKRITSEVCVHHLHFTSADYARLGTRIKCNPAIKTADDQAGLWKALKEGRLDVIATDHAPHLYAEKAQGYRKAPAGLPLVQHSLMMVLRWVQQGRLELPEAVALLSHKPAALFDIQDRGYLDEGAWADMVLLEDRTLTVAPENILYQCGWSPLEGETFNWLPRSVWVSGHLAYDQGRFYEKPGERLRFAR